MSEQQANYNALSVIDSVDIREVTGTMAKISQFQQVVQKNLKKDYDYGIVPGTQKPSLLKPGAEKIFMLLGMRSEFEMVDSTRDFDKGFFQYAVKCKLYKGDVLITEGIGAANNRERKWLKQDPYSVDNTVLKMARKRSMTDAALTVGSLSDIFTQDLSDDTDIEGQPVQQKKTATDQDGSISKAQAKRMFALAEGNSEIVRMVLKEYGYEKSEQVQKTEYDEICSKIEAMRDEFKQEQEEERPEEAAEEALEGGASSVVVATANADTPVSGALAGEGTTIEPDVLADPEVTEQ